MAKSFGDKLISKPARQLLRYGLVGLVSNLAVYFMYLLITCFSVEPKVAMTLVYVVGASIGFIGNLKWTFAHSGHFSGKALRYVLVHLCGYLLNFLIICAFVDWLGYAHQMVQAMAIIVVGGFLFLAFKHFVCCEGAFGVPGKI